MKFQGNVSKQPVTPKKICDKVHSEMLLADDVIYNVLASLFNYIKCKIPHNQTAIESYFTVSIGVFINWPQPHLFWVRLFIVIIVLVVADVK